MIRLLSILLLLGLGSCSNNLDEAKRISRRPDARLEYGKQVEIVYTGNGKPRIRVKAPALTRHDTEKPWLEFDKGIVIYFYDEWGRVDNKLTANYATAVENSTEMTARNNVVVVNSKGDKLHTEELIWDEKRKVIYSNAFVKISTPNEVIYGNGMTANQEFTDYTIRKITGRIKVNK